MRFHRKDSRRASALSKEGLDQMPGRSRTIPLSRLALVALAAACLAGCGSPGRDRLAATTLMGAGLGIPGGPIGVAVGAGVGAVAGALIPKGVLEGKAQEASR
jgi:hypothetical protein